MFRRQKREPVDRCVVCGREYYPLSSILPVCPDCIRERFDRCKEIVYRAHELSRTRFRLPYPQPSASNGVKCIFCARECSLSRGDVGYCGLTIVDENGRLRRIAGNGKWGLLDWYYDPLPTNCVAEWFCPASTGIGYPKYSVSERGPEIGYYNLAVFYGSCNLDCLYCQNWQYREYHLNISSKLVHVDELVRAADSNRVTCVCYFGGDPSSQIVHALVASKRMFENAQKKNRVFRICWETNGQISPIFLRQVIELSLRSGGIVKVDIKAGTGNMYRALTDGEYSNVLRTIREVAKRVKERPEVPLLTISLLVVPGYVDHVEIENVCKLINELGVDVPLSFLAFHPDYLMSDLPPTSRKHMDLALKIAKEYGIEMVNVGNKWLLGDYY